MDDNTCNFIARKLPEEHQLEPGPVYDKYVMPLMLHQCHVSCVVCHWEEDEVVHAERGGVEIGPAMTGMLARVTTNEAKLYHEE